MQLRTPIHLVLRACCLPMQLRAPLRLVLRANCSSIDLASYSAPAAMPMDTALCSAPATAHAGTAVPEGTTFASIPLPRLLMKHLQHKAFAATYV